jgi:hypothetical protein
MDMDRKTPPIDSVNAVLEACIVAFPVSSFVISLYQQYIKRGSLSKKQLQGLYQKASGIEDLPPGKLAALEVIIKKMPTRNKYEMPDAKPLYEKDASTGEMIEAILSKFPTHKTVLFMKSKYDNHQLLSESDLMDLKRFKQIADKK